MVTLHHGKLEDVLPTLAPDSIDSCVTDTPYHLTAGKKGGAGDASVNPDSPAGRAMIGTGFMGMKWDGGDVAFKVETWLAVFRVLKPGAHLLAFGGTRTHHRMVCAIEDAGFEIRDEFDWVFFTGFPKSSNQEGEWKGWGTATKPYKEPICVARKPLIGTVPDNLAAHRTGALNIDGCRIPYASDDDRETAHNNALGPVERFKTTKAIFEGGRQNGGFADTHCAQGRWPAGLIHDGSGEVLATFPNSDGQNGDLNVHARVRVSNGIYGDMAPAPDAPARGDSGSASRFFFCAKASREDREAGCEELSLKIADTEHKRPRTELDDPRRTGTTPRKNHHPTVKPTALMRWLCRLVTPPGGTVLDCFMGSGSTGRAAVLEGFNFVGIEMTDEYIPIARARIAEAEGALFSTQ